MTGPASFPEDIALTVDRPASMPRIYALSQNYPNPFNPVTTIRFDIPQETDARKGSRHRTTLCIFDVRGRLVRTLIDEKLDPGSYRSSWDGKTENGGNAASGIYFYRIVSGEFTATKKMILMK